MSSVLVEWRSRLHSVAEESWYHTRLLCKTVLFIYVPIMAVLAALHFPYDTDISPRTAPLSRRARSFYEAAYSQAGSRPGLAYQANAKETVAERGMEERIRQFVLSYGLEHKQVLEVGSGRGYLQSVVTDYTGLDLSAAAAKHYHKRYVVGSATALPFPDNSYDAVWTIWVMEHVPTPEKALSEIRRVLKPGGLLYLAVAWNCTPWAADGFDVRPYRDYNWRGKLVKATVPVRRLGFFQFLYQAPIRLIRWTQYTVDKGTALHFRALQPNYDFYWEPDSDAAVSLDSFEVYLWFKSRGDQCLNCEKPAAEWLRLRLPMILRIDK